MQIELSKEMIGLILADYEYHAHQLRFDVGDTRSHLFDNYREIAAHLRSEAEMEPWQCCSVCTPEYFEEED